MKFVASNETSIASDRYYLKRCKWYAMERTELIVRGKCVTKAVRERSFECDMHKMTPSQFKSPGQVAHWCSCGAAFIGKECFHISRLGLTLRVDSRDGQSESVAGSRKEHWQTKLSEMVWSYRRANECTRLSVAGHQAPRQWWWSSWK